MSTMTLQLPMNYVDVDREEMEYFDGGATLNQYWWGYAVNLNSSECGRMSDLYWKQASVFGFAGVICALIPDITLSKVAMVAAGFCALNYAFAAVDLGTANREGKHATLTSMGPTVTIKIW